MNKHSLEPVHRSCNPSVLRAGWVVSRLLSTLSESHHRNNKRPQKMKTHLFKLFVGLSILAITAPPLHAGPSASVSLRLKFYAIRKEDDGLGGNGVDLYLAYLVSGPISSFGGSTPVAGGLSTGNGPGEPRNVHRRGDSLFTVDIPDGASVAVHLHMIESDETTSQIKKAFGDGHPPNFSVGARSVSPGDIVDVFKGSIEPIRRFLSGSNTDDDYGHWSFVLKNTGGKVTTSIQERGVGCSEDFQNESVSIDGQWRDLMGVNFKDSENDIGAELEINAK